MIRKIGIIASIASVVVFGAPIKIKVDYLGGCSGTLYGCCEDSLTPCNYKNCSNCVVETKMNYTHVVEYNTSTTISNTTHELVGGCKGTMYGCCNDLITPCSFSDCSNCYIYSDSDSDSDTVNKTQKNYQYIGGCSGTLYGCCEDMITPCSFSNCSDCKQYF